MVYQGYWNGQAFADRSGYRVYQGTDDSWYYSETNQPVAYTELQQVQPQQQTFNSSGQQSSPHRYTQQMRDVGHRLGGRLTGMAERLRRDSRSPRPNAGTSGGQSSAYVPPSLPLGLRAQELAAARANTATGQGQRGPSALDYQAQQQLLIAQRQQTGTYYGTQHQNTVQAYQGQQPGSEWERQQRRSTSSEHRSRYYGGSV
jgi:hypothetical protein